MKKIFLIFIELLIIFFFSTVNCISLEIDKDIYKEQFNLSGATQLNKNLPSETVKILDDIGVNDNNWDSIIKINPTIIFSKVIEIFKGKINTPISSMLPIIAIILLNAILHFTKTSFSSTHIQHSLTYVSVLCICMCIIQPLIQLIYFISMIIKSAAGFILIYVPVVTGIMIASGQPISATSNHAIMIFLGELISQISSTYIVPIMSNILGISIISSLSSTLKLNKICDFFHKSLKWILSLFSTIFISMITLQNIIAVPADNIGSSTIKFAISSFVPIIGGAVSDAFLTVKGCLKLLKSGVGAFGILAGGLIFLPTIIECIIWILFLGICSFISEIFELNKISELIISCQKVVQTMLVLIIFSMITLIISTALILIVGGG